MIDGVFRMHECQATMLHMILAGVTDATTARRVLFVLYSSGTVGRAQRELPVDSEHVGRNARRWSISPTLAKQLLAGLPPPHPGWRKVYAAQTSKVSN